MMREIQEGDSFSLVKDQLQVKVLTPWSSLYRHTRFQHSAFMPQVIYNGIVYTSAESTPDGRSVNCGMGLCCEYKCPGLDQDVPEGEMWLKPGVGLLQRGKEPWNFQSEVCTEGMPVKVYADDACAVFECETPHVRGYAYREKKTIELSGNSIRLTVHFQNTGEKEWDMVDYCHNFLSLNGRHIDEHHHLLYPSIQGEKDEADGNGTIKTWHGLEWTREPEKMYLYRFFNTKDAAFAWLLYLDDSSMRVAERISEKPSLMQVWGDNRRIAPEAFVSIKLKPGEEKEWSREWFFD